MSFDLEAYQRHKRGERSVFRFKLPGESGYTPEPDAALSAAGEASRTRERLQAARDTGAEVSIPEGHRDKSLFENALDYLDRPGQFGRGVLSGALKGEGLEGGWKRGTEGFRGERDNPAAEIREELTKGQGAIGGVSRWASESDAGKFGMDLAISLLTDPTSYLGVGAVKNVGKVAAKDLAKHLPKQIDTYAGRIQSGKLAMPGTKMGSPISSTASDRIAQAAVTRQAAGRKVSPAIAGTGRTAGDDLSGHVASVIARNRAVPAETALDIGEAAVKGARHKGTYLKFAGVPVVPMKPITTALGAVIDRTPGASKVRDIFGRTFSFNYTPLSVKGMERTRVSAAKERITAAAVRAPVVASRAIHEAQAAFRKTPPPGADQTRFYRGESAISGKSPGAEIGKREVEDASEISMSEAGEIVPRVKFFTRDQRMARAYEELSERGGRRGEKLGDEVLTSDYPVGAGKGIISYLDLANVKGPQRPHPYPSRVEGVLDETTEEAWIPEDIAGKRRPFLTENISDEAARAAAEIVEGTKTARTPMERAAANIAAKIFNDDKLAFQLNNMPITVLDKYFMHLYKDHPQVVERAFVKWRAMSTAGVKAGKPGFTHKRLIPTIADAKKLGLTPIEDARIVSSVHKALTEQAVTFQKMGNELLAMGEDVVSPSMLPGYVRMDNTIPVLNELYVHPEIATALKRINPIILNEDDAINGVFKLYDSTLSMWKGVVTFSPAFHARNFAGGLFLNIAEGVGIQDYVRATRVLLGQGSIKLGETTYQMQDIKRIFMELGLEGQGVFKDIGQTTRSATAEATRALNALKRGKLDVAYRPNPFKGSQAIGQGADTLHKMALFLKKLGESAPATDAAASVRKALYDYGRLTPVERNVFKRVVPFYAWTRQNVPHMVEKFVQSPGMFTGAVHLRDTFVNVNEVGEEYLPQYLHERGFFPLSVDEKGNVWYANINLPYTDLKLLGGMVDLATTGDVSGIMDVVGLTPAISLPTELAMNRDRYGQEITKTPDIPEAARDDRLRHVGKSLLGASGRFTIDLAEGERLARQEEVDKAKGLPERVTKLGDTPIPPSLVGLSPRHPARDAYSAQFQERDRLRQATEEAESRGVTVPSTEEAKAAGQPFRFNLRADTSPRRLGGTEGTEGFRFAIRGQPQVEAGEAPAAVKQAMEQAGVDVSWEPWLKLLMKRESSGRVSAYNDQPVRNTWSRPGQAFDENATGLFQMLPSTFKENAAPGHGNIWSPIDNTLAAINYIRKRYGHPSKIPHLADGKGYKGY